jgi:hypothetical protein
MLPRETKQADSKGRITLGERFKNRSVIITCVDETEVKVTLARVIPEREAWLYDNSEAKQAVFAGIQQARDKNFTTAPDLDADLKGVDGIPDGE